MTLLMVLWTLVVTTGLVLITWRIAAGIWGLVQTTLGALRSSLGVVRDSDPYEPVKLFAALLYYFGHATWLCFASLVFLWAATRPLAPGQVGHELLDAVLGLVVFGVLWAVDRKLWPDVHKSRLAT
ncbi:hypothetical protein E3G66_003694 [Mycobacteroides abscessus]|uniref:Uncharacterized protein n=1 Tax=Mycobacteroides saopaulense TaxID=1578165 RepID=A0A1X0ITI4_9MYCO|nr:MULTISPECIES: hypothetical protein [Mycobacteroides]ORB52025.1 hypothetical protein BST43_19945 [Mycobacteroides saopaulense]OTR15119.1 hypothetical protein B9M80_18530 [Mycobacteroides abscessus]QOF39490.1 hypothetical protein E3G66_003694 [Mycobacteroides abscessus]SLG55463.1 Uncharacterised protein [Mycobacteroides abscessus subsp. abscessus]SLI01172.1 Uncharacterised protein [Mycobacteroides abscessus subsp. abscessus]